MTLAEGDREHIRHIGLLVADFTQRWGVIFAELDRLEAAEVEQERRARKEQFDRMRRRARLGDDA